MLEPAGEVMDYRECWERVRTSLRNRFGEALYAAWLQQIEYEDCADRELKLSVPNHFVLDRISSYYFDEISASWRREAPQAPRVSICVRMNGIETRTQNATRTHNTRTHNEINDESAPAGAFSAGGAISSSAATRERSMATAASSKFAGVGRAALDDKLTFENFMTGASNEFACAAARQVAQHPSVAFNPLFLYGASGLGKTHLMQAIAWDIRARQSGRTVIYISAERFIYYFVQAVRSNDTHAFKERFRGVDLLMIDDIQFIGHKGSTQIEFLHTLDELIDNSRQVVISADCAPGDLGECGVQERVRQRLGNGLCADLQAADYDLRLKILDRKRLLAKRQFNHLEIADEVLEFLAARITDNVRELEGALNKLAAHAAFVGGAADLEAAQVLLRDHLRACEKRVTIGDIQRRVCEFYNLRMPDLLSPRRHRAIARPRQVAMYLAKLLTTASLPEIGRKFDGRDHTTVIHAVKKIDALIASDPAINADIAKLQRDLSP